MKKNSFTGWKNVFSFSIQQMTKGIAFKVTTALITILLIAGMIIANIVIADKTKEETCKIEKVYVLDESGLNETPFGDMLPLIGGDKYSKVSFETVQSGNKIEDIIKNASEDGQKTVVLNITKENKKYFMQIAIPSGSSIKKSEAKSLLNKLVLCFENNKLMQIGLNEEQLKVVAKPINTSISDAGEADKSMGEYVVEMLAPMLLSFILYFMIYQYGGKTCSAIVTEKTSKLMELLLTSVHPNSLIMGKILASSCVGIIQFLVWIFSAVIGYFIGDKVAVSMYPDYKNPLYEVFDLMKDNTAHGAFSIPSIILAIVILCVGFFFFSVIAGFVGSFLSKPEQVSLGNQLFVMPVTVAFMATYFAPLAENDIYSNIIRLVPLTAPFSSPADLIVGSMSFGMGILSLILLLITTFLFVILAGKLYKGLILYNGSKLSPAKVLGVLRTK